MNVHKFAAYNGYIVVNNKPYTKPNVEIKSNGKWSIHYFDSDEEALSFIMNLKEKCKKSGNELL